jgi:hypothetical protein
MYATYGKHADFKIVYVREAHPSDGWQVPVNEREGVIIATPRTASEREKVAGTCAANLKITIPVVVDGMNDAVERAYAGWPDRIYIVDKDGRIAYKGAPGPAGFRPKEAEESLKKLLGLAGDAGKQDK